MFVRQRRINFMNFIKNFFKGIWSNMLNIYVEEKDIREAYGDEYADRFGALDPMTGKKMISAKKIFVRIVAVLILVLYIFYLARITKRGLWGGWMS